MGTKKRTLEVYFSHSWRPEDVDINVIVWEQICDRCAVAVDKQGQVLKKDAFYVNRLEFLIGQSDAFIAVLPYREQAVEEDGFGTDFELQCSKAALFEIRLAERARKPRLIIYDSKTRFKPANPSKSKLVKYIPINVQRELQRDNPGFTFEISEWLSELQKRCDNGHIQVRNDVTILTNEENPQATKIHLAIEKGLNISRFSERHVVKSEHLDSEIIGWLQASDLLIAEVGSIDSAVLGIAHGFFTPTIRFMTSKSSIPYLLTGHPVGYEKDLIVVENPEELTRAIKERVLSMDLDRELLKNLDSGIAYFHRNLNNSHKVFISHNLDGEDGRVVEEAIKALNRKSINAWEYRDNLKAGVEWKTKLENAMKDTTHVVFIADDEFEKSGACWDELMYFSKNAKIDMDHVFPFLWGGRKSEIAEYRERDNLPLPANPVEAAGKIAERLEEEINICKAAG